MLITENQSEVMRNQLLRRVDWRFLLGQPLAETSICFVEGQLADAVTLMSKRVLLPDMTAQCDLAVIVDPNHAALCKVYTVLGNGGHLYSEWYSPLVGGPVGVRERLEKAGFVDVMCYWAWPLPNCTAPLFWLPLESPAAISYFLTHRPRSRLLSSAITRAIQRVLWYIAYRTNLITPLFVTARKPESIQSIEAKSNFLFETIRSYWEYSLLGKPPLRLTSLLLTGGLSSINKVVSLIFADDEPEPRLIVKQPRVPESIPMLAHEAATLRMVQSLQPNGIAGVPQVLFWDQSGGNPVLGETVLNGQPIFTFLRRSNYRHLALQATNWLIKLANRRVLQPREIWWKLIAEPALEDFERSFGAVIDHDLLDKTRAILSTVGDLPMTCEQRDFSPWNVLIAPDESLVVLDWESAEIQGLPGLDLIYFLTYLAFFLDGAMASRHFRDSYMRVLDRTTFTGGVAIECQAHYATFTGVSLETLLDLRLLVWIIHARSEYQQFIRETGETPTVARLQNSLFLQLWHEEVLQHEKISR